MVLTYAHWSLDDAEAVLRFRARRASGDFDDYRRVAYRREHKSRYADGAVPNSLPARPLGVPQSCLRDRICS
jgi:hypothetical protein